MSRNQEEPQIQNDAWYGMDRNRDPQDVTLNQFTDGKNAVCDVRRGVVRKRPGYRRVPGDPSSQPLAIIADIGGVVAPGWEPFINDPGLGLTLVFVPNSNLRLDQNGEIDITFIVYGGDDLGITTYHWDFDLPSGEDESGSATSTNNVYTVIGEKTCKVWGTGTDDNVYSARVTFNIVAYDAELETTSTVDQWTPPDEPSGEGGAGGEGADPDEADDGDGKHWPDDDLRISLSLAPSYILSGDTFDCIVRFDRGARPYRVTGGIEIILLKSKGSTHNFPVTDTIASSFQKTIAGATYTLPTGVDYEEIRIYAKFKGSDGTVLRSGYRRVRVARAGKLVMSFSDSTIDSGDTTDITVTATTYNGYTAPNYAELVEIPVLIAVYEDGQDQMKATQAYDINFLGASPGASYSEGTAQPVNASTGAMTSPASPYWAGGKTTYRVEVTAKETGRGPLVLTMEVRPMTADADRYASEAADLTVYTGKFLKIAVPRTMTEFEPETITVAAKDKTGAADEGYKEEPFTVSVSVEGSEGGTPKMSVEGEAFATSKDKALSNDANVHYTDDDFQLEGNPTDEDNMQMDLLIEAETTGDVEPALAGQAKVCLNISQLKLVITTCPAITERDDTFTFTVQSQNTDGTLFNWGDAEVDLSLNDAHASDAICDDGGDPLASVTLVDGEWSGLIQIKGGSDFYPDSTITASTSDEVEMSPDTHDLAIGYEDMSSSLGVKHNADGYSTAPFGSHKAAFEDASALCDADDSISNTCDNGYWTAARAAGQGYHRVTRGGRRTTGITLSDYTTMLLELRWDWSMTKEFGGDISSLFKLYYSQDAPSTGADYKGWAEIPLSSCRIEGSSTDETSDEGEETYFLDISSIIGNVEDGHDLYIVAMGAPEYPTCSENWGYPGVDGRGAHSELSVEKFYYE